jgi:hypothetical protein
MMHKTKFDFSNNQKFSAMTIAATVLISLLFGSFLSNTTPYMNAYAAESYSLIRQRGFRGTENGHLTLLGL